MFDPKTSSVDEFAGKTLSHALNEASSQVDFEVKEAGIVIEFGGIEIGKILIQFQLRGVHLVAALLVIGFVSIISQLLNK
jgi:hypothetical protein